MQGNDQHVFLFRQPDQLCSDQRGARQIEAALRFILQDLLQLLLPLCFIHLPQVYALGLQISKLMGLLSWFSILGEEISTQHFVTGDKLIEAPA
jgi:hypothetical protein